MNRRLLVSRLLAAAALLILPLLVISLSQLIPRKPSHPINKQDAAQPQEAVSDEAIKLLIEQLGSDDERKQFQAEERLISLSRRDDRIKLKLEAALQHTKQAHQARIQQTLHNIDVCSKNGE